MPETIYDALIEAVKACGGSKVVAPRLWGEGDADDIVLKAKKLTRCLNPEHSEKLSLDEVMVIVGMARAVGCHSVMQFLADALSYAEPQPIEPEDERAQLQREFIESTKALARMAQRIEQLERPVAVRAAA